MITLPTKTITQQEATAQPSSCLQSMAGSSNTDGRPGSQYHLLHISKLKESRDDILLLLPTTISITLREAKPGSSIFSDYDDTRGQKALAPLSEAYQSSAPLFCGLTGPGTVLGSTRCRWAGNCGNGDALLPSVFSSTIFWPSAAAIVCLFTSVFSCHITSLPFTWRHNNPDSYKLKSL